jgi:bacterioferritin-associated ferredoxin
MFVCTCEICVDGREYHRILAGLSDTDKLWMESYYEKICNAAMDANVNQAILDGSWGSAVEQLEEALVKAKQKREQNGITKG